MGRLLQRPLALTVACLTLLIPLQLHFYTPYYELNDDTFKVFFTEGVGTDFTPSEFIGYSNPAWGLLFKVLSTHFSGVPWYGLALLGVQFLSIGALLYALALSPRPGLKMLGGGATYLGIFYTFFVGIQYTVTSILAAQCAFLLLLSLWQNGGPSLNRAGWVLAGFLLVVSSLIRLDGLLIAAFCALPLFLTAWREADPAARRALQARKLTLLFPVLLIAGGALYNRLWYAVTPGWAEFNRFDHERLELQDYRIDPYNAQTKPFFDAAGWSENDYRMFKEWYFMDKHLYDTDRMRHLAARFPRFGSEGKPSTCHSLPEILGEFWPQTVLLYFLAFLLLVPLERWRYLVLQMGWVLAVLTLMIYAARAPDRVVVPLLTLPLAAAVYFLGSPAQGKGRNAKRQVPGWIGMAFLALLLLPSLRSCAQIHFLNQQAQRGEKLLKDCLAQWNPREDQLYVVWASGFPYEAFNAFDDFGLFKKIHLFELAVYQRSPNAQKMLDHFGIKDLFREMVDNPKVSLICTPQECGYYQQYMREKYSLETVMVETYECPFFRVFRVLTPTAAKGSQT
jgi:hypothetical protein